MSYEECESCKHFTIEDEKNLGNMFKNFSIPVAVVGCELDNLDELEDGDFGKHVTQLLTDELCPDYEVK